MQKSILINFSENSQKFLMVCLLSDISKTLYCVTRKRG